MTGWLQSAERPFIQSEWYAKQSDLAAKAAGAGFRVATQLDRGLFYQNHALGLMDHPGAIGWHWFKYRDNYPNDKRGVPSNTDSNKGIVLLSLELYQPLMQAMDQLNRQVYSLADYFDRTE